MSPVRDESRFSNLPQFGFNFSTKKDKGKKKGVINYYYCYWSTSTLFLFINKLAKKKKE